MRGTGYAIGEIVFWMLAAGLIGAAIGWIIRGFFGGGAKVKELEGRLGDERERYAKLSAELGDRKRKIESLEGEVEAKLSALTKAKEVNTSLESDIGALRSDMEAKVGSIAAEKDAEIERLGAEVAGIAGLQSTLGQRESEISEMRSKLADAEARLAAASGELSDLRASHAGCGVATEEATGKIAALESALGERDSRLADLEARLASTSNELSELQGAHANCGAADVDTTTRLEQLEALVADQDAGIRGLEAELVAAAEKAGAVEPAQTASSTTKPSWQSGVTPLGTPGASHRDDLKVINGVGPKLEATLNGFGIQTWEQLAALTAAEVETVDSALAEFPGRIERDQWVRQAADLVARFPDKSNRPDRTTFLNESEA